MKKKILIVVSCILIAVVLFPIWNTFGKISYLPLEVNKIDYIGLYGGHIHRKATEEEKVQIVSWLNSIKKYDKVIIIPVGNGKPDYDNIQIFFNNKRESFALSVDKDGILLGGGWGTAGYIVTQSDLSELLAQIK
jgi:hypothetical protein